MLILLMIMSGWHQSLNIEDRRGWQPPEPPQIQLPIDLFKPKPVKTIRITK
jgi:hypothetical protein